MEVFLLMILIDNILYFGCTKPRNKAFFYPIGFTILILIFIIYKITIMKSLKKFFIFLAVTAALCVGWYYADKHLHWFFAALVALFVASPVTGIYAVVDLAIKGDPFPEKYWDILREPRYWNLFKWLSIVLVSFSLLKAILI
jgi:hypothetical protein